MKKSVVSLLLVLCVLSTVVCCFSTVASAAKLGDSWYLNNYLYGKSKLNDENNDAPYSVWQIVREPGATTGTFMKMKMEPSTGFYVDATTEDLSGLCVDNNGYFSPGRNGATGRTACVAIGFTAPASANYSFYAQIRLKDACNPDSLPLFYVMKGQDGKIEYPRTYDIRESTNHENEEEYYLEEGETLYFVSDPDGDHVGDCSWIKYTVTLVGFENTSTPPDTSDDDPIEPPTTTYPFVDVTGDPNWFETKEPVGNYDYSFCLVGDTQMVTSRYPEHLPTLYNWIADNAASKKMSYVIGLGDITDQDSKAEWEAAKNAIGKLNGVVPYLLLRGNQDTSYRFNATFGTDAYKSQCKGYYEEGKIENVYTIFKAGGVDYLLIAMDWSPSNQCLAWADGVIEQFPNHRVIISTHSYLYKDGTTVDAEDPDAPDTFASPDNNLNNGDEIWNKLVSKHENIFLVLSGHIGSDDVVVSQRGGAHGNVVTQVLANPQDVDAEIGATGMVAMLYISESNSTITIEQYSTVRGMYYRQESQQVVSFAGKMTPDTDVGTEPDSETSEMLPSVTDEVEESESADGHSDTHEEILILVIPIVVAVAVVVVLVLFRIRKKKR